MIVINSLRSKYLIKFIDVPRVNLSLSLTLPSSDKLIPEVPAMDFFSR
jgi:hypothetical protein